MSKRASAGEATIYRDSDGRWHGWITVGTRADGKLDRRHRTGKTRAEVAAKIRHLEHHRANDTVSAVRSETVAAWLDHWLTTIAPNRVRPRTLESYETIIRLHIAPYIGGQRLDRLQPEHLELLYKLLLERGLSSTTVLRVHRVISRALKVATQRGRTHRNIASLVDPPAQRKAKIATALEPDEAIAVLRAAAGSRNAARWTVALALGLRQSEALALQWSDINLLDGTLEIRRTLHRVKGKGLVYEAPKTSKSERKLALPPRLVAELIEHKRRQTGERMLAANEWHDEDLVFAQPNGRPIDKKADYDAWRDLPKESRRPARPAARRPAHRRHPPASRRRAPARRDGATRPRPDPHDDGHLQPRDAGPGARGRAPDGGDSLRQRTAADAAGQQRTAANCNQRCNQRHVR